jgi:hypothetical protein
VHQEAQLVESQRWSLFAGTGGDNQCFSPHGVSFEKRDRSLGCGLHEDDARFELVDMMAEENFHKILGVDFDGKVVSATKDPAHSDRLYQLRRQR